MPLTGAAEPSDAEPLPALFPVPEPAAPASEPGAPLSRAGRAPVRGGDAEGPERRVRPADPRRQLAFFGAEASDPAVADLAGLLAGPAEASVMGGTARLSLVVDDAWRVHVLVAELAARGLSASWEATGDGRHAVRTSYTRLLKPLAAAWLRGPTKRPPDGFHLNGRRLRLWLAAAGSVTESEVLLHLDAAGDEHVTAVGTALAAAGLPNAAVDSALRAYRITNHRDLTRLAELVGDPPHRTPPTAWPTRP